MIPLMILSPEKYQNAIYVLIYLVYFKHLHTITSSPVPFQSIEDPVLTIPFGLPLLDTVKEVNLYTHKCGALVLKFLKFERNRDSPPPH